MTSILNIQDNFYNILFTYCDSQLFFNCFVVFAIKGRKKTLRNIGSVASFFLEICITGLEIH